MMNKRGPSTNPCGAPSSFIKASDVNIDKYLNGCTHIHLNGIKCNKGKHKPTKCELIEYNFFSFKNTLL